MTDAQKDLIAELASGMTETHMDVLKEHEGMDWRMLAFANVLALRSIANLTLQTTQQLADVALMPIIRDAMAQQLVAKRFTDRAAMNRWLAQQGILPPGDEDEEAVH